MTPRLCIGTSGFSVWYSDDLGETLERSLSDSGLYSESRVTAFSTHPGAPDALLAGTDSGIYRLDLRTRAWTHLPSPMDNLAVWSLAQALDSPNTILAGTRPGAIYRSVDGGRSWQPAQAAFPDSCAFVMRTRVTQIQFDRPSVAQP